MISLHCLHGPTVVIAHLHGLPADGRGGSRGLIRLVERTSWRLMEKILNHIWTSAVPSRKRTTPSMRRSRRTRSPSSSRTPCREREDAKAGPAGVRMVPATSVSRAELSRPRHARIKTPTALTTLFGTRPLSATHLSFCSRMVTIGLAAPGFIEVRAESAMEFGRGAPHFARPRIMATPVERLFVGQALRFSPPVLMVSWCGSRAAKLRRMKL
jgi:hypothetical protein